MFKLHCLLVVRVRQIGGEDFYKVVEGVDASANFGGNVVAAVLALPHKF
jgi:hypothetical protein